MKRIIYFTTIACFLASCYDDYYSEGRVKTISATEVTINSAILNGNIQIATEGREAKLKIRRRGFIYGTSSNDLNIAVNDKVSGEGNFSCNIDSLSPNTKYYVRAVAVVNRTYGTSSYDTTSVVYYGNIIEFTTPADDYIVLQSAGIMVQKNDISAGASWDDANSLCATSRAGGFGNWRLPTRGELVALYDSRATIGGFSTARYWSGERNLNYSNEYYALYFSSGSISSWHSYSSFCVRAVRTLP